MITANTLTTKEAARLLGASVRSVQLWVDAGELQAYKTPGGHRRISRQCVDAIVEQRAAALTPKASEAS